MTPSLAKYTVENLEENGKKAEYLNRLQAQAETMEDQQKKLSEKYLGGDFTPREEDMKDEKD